MDIRDSVCLLLRKNGVEVDTDGRLIRRPHYDQKFQQTLILSLAINGGLLGRGKDYYLPEVSSLKLIPQQELIAA
jgi:hypothetical protein